MALYRYRAHDNRSNKVVRSTIQADSESAAAKLLMAQKVIPLKIELVDESTSSFISKITNHVSNKELVIMTRQFATMMNAGLSLTQTLSAVTDQTTGRALKNIMSDVQSRVNNGTPFSDSLARYPKVFSKFYISIVRAGETSGKLDTSLQRLADQLEHDADMMSKVKGAMVYPTIVLAVIIAVVVFMLVTLVPQVKQLYDDMHKVLPLQTQILQAIADFMVKFWYVILIVIGVLVVLFIQWRNTAGGRRSLDLIKLNMPMFKTLIRKLYMARFARTMETLVQAGVSILESLQISADSANNTLVRDDILSAMGPVKNGKPMSDSLSGRKYILPFLPRMIKIGEASGNIDTMLGKVADYYNKEVDNAIKSISTLIEPMLMVIMAILIGFIVISVLLPIYQLSTSLQR